MTTHTVLWRKRAADPWAVYAVRLTADEAAAMVAELRAVGAEARIREE